MARLTNEMRRVFVTAVAKHLPELSAWPQWEWEKGLREVVEAELPQEVHRFDKAYPGLLTRNAYVSLRLGLLDAGRRVGVLGAYVVNDYGARSEKHPEVAAYCARAVESWLDHVGEAKAREELLERVMQITRGAMTTDALAKLLPELAHLIPASPPPRTLPTVQGASDLVAALVKAGLKLEVPDAAQD